MSDKDVINGFIGAGRIGQLHTGLLNRYVEGVRKNLFTTWSKRQCASVLRMKIKGIDGVEPVYIATACMLSMQEKRSMKIKEVK